MGEAGLLWGTSFTEQRSLGSLCGEHCFHVFCKCSKCLGAAHFGNQVLAQAHLVYVGTAICAPTLMLDSTHGRGPSVRVCCVSNGVDWIMREAALPWGTSFTEQRSLGSPCGEHCFHVPFINAANAWGQLILETKCWHKLI